jgi:hypothetical protein
MGTAAVLWDDNAFNTYASRDEVLARYRRLRAISAHHHSEALKFLSGDAILHQARRLGLAVGDVLLTDNISELTLAFDLAIHTAPVDRSRAIDRYARSAGLAPESEETHMLRAMQEARFALVRFERRHELAGVIVRDLFRDTELWLVDEGLEISMPDGSVLATRLITPDRFSMTAGAGVPFDIELLEHVLAGVPQIGRKTTWQAIDDRRFAEAVYRIAIADGTMERVEYKDPTPEAG